MPSVMKTLFLNPPSFEKFDGGAGSRWPATREIESYWYPVWLAYPAGLLDGSRLLDAPRHFIPVIRGVCSLPGVPARTPILTITVEAAPPLERHPLSDRSWRT